MLSAFARITVRRAMRQFVRVPILIIKYSKILLTFVNYKFTIIMSSGSLIVCLNLIGEKIVFDDRFIFQNSTKCPVMLVQARDQLHVERLVMIRTRPWKPTNFQTFSNSDHSTIHVN